MASLFENFEKTFTKRRVTQKTMQSWENSRAKTPTNLRKHKKKKRKPNFHTNKLLALNINAFSVTSILQYFYELFHNFKKLT